MNSSSIVGYYVAGKMAIKNIVVYLPKILNMIEGISKSDFKDVHERVEKIDLPDKLKEILGFVKDCDDFHVNSLNSRSMTASLLSLEKSIRIIHTSLEKIGSKMVTHKDRWFSSWKSLDYFSEFDDILVQDELLEKRYNRCKDLLKIPWNELKEAGSKKTEQPSEKKQHTEKKISHSEIVIPRVLPEVKKKYTPPESDSSDDEEIEIEKIEKENI
jgi:hypothetical protein